MPDLGTLAAPIQGALHAYLTADPDSPAEETAWHVYLASLGADPVVSIGDVETVGELVSA